jgi:hypothetical protein
MSEADQTMRVAMRTPDSAYKLFAKYNGYPHGDFRFASGQVVYDVEFPTVLDAALFANDLGKWFAKADLRSAVSVAFSDRPVTSLEQSVTMTFMCY